MSQLSMIKFKNKKIGRFWFNWIFVFCDLIIANGSNSELVIELRSQEIIGRAGFIENFDNNKNIEFGFEVILSKNVTHWDFDNEHSEKKQNDVDLWKLALLINPMNINAINLNQKIKTNYERVSWKFVVLTCHNLNKFDYCWFLLIYFISDLLKEVQEKWRKIWWNIRLGLGGLPYCRLTIDVADARMILNTTGSRIERS